MIRVQKFTALRFAPLNSVGITPSRNSPSPFFSSAAFLHTVEDPMASKSQKDDEIASPLAAIAVSSRRELPHVESQKSSIAPNTVLLDFPTRESDLRQLLSSASPDQILHLPRPATMGKHDAVAVSSSNSSVRFFDVPHEEAKGVRSPSRSIELGLRTGASNRKIWLDIAASLGSDPKFAPAVCLRERVSGAVFAPARECCSILGPFPRLGLGAIPMPPPPPPSRLYGLEQAPKISPVEEAKTHLKRVVFALRRVQFSFRSSSSSGSKLVLLDDESRCHLIPEGSDALQKVERFSNYLLESMVGKGEDAAVWEHHFCRALDMYLRDEGCVAGLVDILKSKRRSSTPSGEEEPTQEAGAFIELISAWTQ